MTLNELLEVCGASSAEDWNLVSWGPAYLDWLLSSEGGGGENYQLRTAAHDSRAAYKPDLAIGIAWGLETNPRSGLGDEPHIFKEDWATKFPDPDATRHFLDFFYNGALVAREPYVSVDGRCDLPIPKRETDGEDVVTGLTITQRQYDVFRVLNALVTTVDYDSYVQRAGFKVEG